MKDKQHNILTIAVSDGFCRKFISFFYNGEVVGDAVFLVSCHQMFKTLKYKVERERQSV